MLPIVAYLLAFAALVAGISLTVQYSRYQRWGPYEWRRRLFDHIHRLHSRRTRLNEAACEFDEQIERLTAAHFAKHLSTITLERLSEFPGIGSATLERLEHAGCRNITDVVHLRQDSIRGIGPSRANDLQAAAQFLIKSARSQFDAGACSAAHQYREELSQLHRDEEARAGSRQKEMAALEVALGKTEPLKAVAKNVTFWAYLRNQGVPGLTDEMLAQALPEPIVSAEPVMEPRHEAPARPPAVPARGMTQIAKPSREAAILPVKAPIGAKSTPTDLFRAELQGDAGDARPMGVHPGLPRMRAFTEFALLVAKADGRVAARERKTIRAFLGEKFGHDEQLVRHIDPLMEQIESKVADEIRTLRDVCKISSAAERSDLFALAERIADACGERNRREQGVLERIAAAFGLNLHADKPAPLAVLATEAAAISEVEFRRTLEIPPDSPIGIELIRRRYCLLSERLDPAKAASLGPKVQSLVERERAQVRRAAEALLAGLGAPLDAPPTRAPADLRHNPDLDDFMGG